MYPLSSRELEKLKKALEAIYTVPFIDDVEDFIWEAIFCYVKNIPLVDPLTNIRKKRLFDIVDPSTSVGWSAKALQSGVDISRHFELVIQRADIFKKSQELGFNSLSMASPPEDLGLALLRHWYGKVYEDAEAQGVTNRRMCILVKSKDRKTYGFLEEDLSDYEPPELYWIWTNETKTGLQGIRKKDKFCVFRWYPNQKQFFERFILPEDTRIFSIEPTRLPMDEVVDLLLSQLNSTA